MLRLEVKTVWKVDKNKEIKLRNGRWKLGIKKSQPRKAIHGTCPQKNMNPLLVSPMELYFEKKSKKDQQNCPITHNVTSEHTKTHAR